MSIRYIRETVIRDLVDLLDAIKDDDSNFITKKFKDNKYKSSISSASKDLIMTFPVICSNTIEPATATMVSKAIERKCVTLLQLLFSASATEEESSIEDFIRKFHNNIKIGNMSVDEYIKLSDEISKDLNHGGIIDDTLFGESAILRSIKEDMKNLDNEYTLSPDSVSENSLQVFKLVDDPYGNTRVLTEKKGGRPRPNRPKPGNNTPQSGGQNNNSKPQSPKDSSTATFPGDSKNKKDHKRNKIKDEIEIQKNEYEIFTKQLLDNDVKKCNELVPSLLIINVNLYDDATHARLKTSAVVGVKARLIATDSFDIIERIYSKHNDSNTLLKLIRASTREISFVKDFLLAVDKAKIDALSKSKKGSASAMWKVLERRAVKSNVNKALRRSNDASAIASLVISQEEADYLNKNYNINLHNTGVARNILQKYNLLSLVIVDETIEVCKFLFDGEETYETLSFNNLERESDGGMYKKVLNLMSKINR